MECDPRWEREHMVQRLALEFRTKMFDFLILLNLRLADIVDLNSGERALMAAWNRYCNTLHLQ